MPGTYEPIAALISSGSMPAVVNFTSIPDTYTDLVLVISGANTSADASVTGYIRFNGDTGSNYVDMIMYADNTNAVTAFTQTSATTVGLWTIMGNTSDAQRRSVMEINILSYANTNFFKSGTNRISTVSANNDWVNCSTWTWRSTAAITSITIGAGSNWRGDSTFSLYGIKAA